MDNAAFASYIGTRAVTLEQASVLLGISPAAMTQWRLAGAASGTLSFGRFVARPDPNDPDRWIVTETSR